MIHEYAVTDANKLKQLQGKDIRLLGEGIPLFPTLNHNQLLDLIEIQVDSDLTILNYYKMKES